MKLLENFGYSPDFILQEYVDNQKEIYKIIDAIVLEFKISRHEALLMSDFEIKNSFDYLKSLRSD